MAGDSEQSLPNHGQTASGEPFLIGVGGGTASGKVSRLQRPTWRRGAKRCGATDSPEERFARPEPSFAARDSGALCTCSGMPSRMVWLLQTARGGGGQELLFFLLPPSPPPRRGLLQSWPPLFKALQGRRGAGSASRSQPRKDSSEADWELLCTGDLPRKPGWRPHGGVGMVGGGFGAEPAGGARANVRYPRGNRWPRKGGGREGSCGHSPASRPGLSGPTWSPGGALPGNFVRGGKLLLPVCRVPWLGRLSNR